MKTGFIFFFLFLGSLVKTWGQADSVALFLQQVKNAEEDSLRLVYADRIPFCLEKTAFGELANREAIPYLSYKKCVNAAMELVAWVVPTSGGQTYYNWFRSFRTGQTYLLKTATNLQAGQSEWLYYDLVSFQVQKQEYFLLLGWNKTRNTNRKIVRVARFEPDGRITFDHRLLARGNSRSGSLSFEYALDGSMMLKQDKKGKRIIFDHLAPFDAKYEGYFMFYGPDASYDALVLENGLWRYRENVK